MEALHEKALDAQRLQMQLQTGKLLPKIIEANSYAKIFVKPVVFSLASTSVEPWLLGSDLATIANEVEPLCHLYLCVVGRARLVS